MSWWRFFTGFGAWNAGRSTRQRESRAGIISHPQDEDRAVTSYGREKTRLECRDLRRNSPLAAGIAVRFADHVVGSGIMPQAKTSDPGWNAAAEEFFGEWAKISDYRQRITFWEMQRLVVQSRLYDGECGFIITDAGQLVPVEAERIRQPDNAPRNVYDGIEVSDAGQVVAYYVHRRDPESGMFTGKDFDRVPAENFIHCANRDMRLDQVRGFPDFVPIVDTIRDLSEYLEATQLKAKNEAKQFYTIENSSGAPEGLPSRLRQTDSGPVLERVETGLVYYLRRGETLRRISNETPSPTFDPFVEKCCRIIGAALGMPYEFVLLDFSETSYSSARAALLQAYRTISNWQQWLSGCFLQRVWNWRIAKAIKAGDLAPAPTDSRGVSQWYRVLWQAPEFGWVDPQAEAQAQVYAITAGASSLTEWCRKRGRDAEDTLREKGTDIATAIRITNEINQKFGTSLAWNQLMTLGLPGQITRAQAEQDAAAKSSTEKST